LALIRRLVPTHTLRRVTRRSPLYPAVVWLRALQLHARWSEADARRLEFYRQFVPSAGLCFDVGANMGNRTKVFLRLGARVVAVEPQPLCIRILHRFLGGNKGLTIVSKVLGAHRGTAELMVSDAHVLSSLSSEWVARTQQSGRFANFEWNRRLPVEMTTLDELIREYGRPDFVKIDVEGFEDKVLEGLSQAVPTLSFEFTPEYLESSLRCIALLERLGEIELNFALGETMRLALKTWVSADELRTELQDLRHDHRCFGDVYVRFPKLATAAT
jgi:FkbM family methyltransferase